MFGVRETRLTWSFAPCQATPRTGQWAALSA